MKVMINKPKLDKQYDKLDREFGALKAEAIRKRINQLIAANTLHEVRLIPQLRLHPLRNNRDGQMALKTIGKYRMLIEPRGDHDLADYRTVKEVEIVEFDVDYHR